VSLLKWRMKLFKFLLEKERVNTLVLCIFVEQRKHNQPSAITFMAFMNRCLFLFFKLILRHLHTPKRPKKKIIIINIIKYNIQCNKI
jgi:hypothetical protein